MDIRQMKWEPKISLTNFPCMDPTRVIPLFQYLYDTNDIDYLKKILTHQLKVEKHNFFPQYKNLNLPLKILKIQ